MSNGGELDYLVVGSGFAGLAFGALMARAGRRVRVLEAHHQAGILKAAPVTAIAAADLARGHGEAARPEVEELRVVAHLLGHGRLDDARQHQADLQPAVAARPLHDPVDARSQGASSSSVVAPGGTSGRIGLPEVALQSRVAERMATGVSDAKSFAQPSSSCVAYSWNGS